MNNRYEDRLAEIKATRKKKNLIYKVLACVGCLVLGITTFAMVTPAITMEAQDDPAAAAVIENNTAAAEQSGVTDEELSEPGNDQNQITDSEKTETVIDEDNSQNSDQTGGQDDDTVIPGSGETQEQDSSVTDNTDSGTQSLDALEEGDAEDTSLIISNIIDNSETTGAEPSEMQAFAFTVRLKSGAEPLADQEFPYVLGETSGTQLFDANGEAVITLKHGESITIMQLPGDTTWHVVAQPCAGYLTDHRIDGGELIDGANTGEQNLTDSASVEYVNAAASYTLPETGGHGTLMFIIAGCLMFIGAGVLLMRRRVRYEA